MFKQRNRQHHSITYRTPFPPKSKSEQSPHKHFSSVSHLSNIESMEDLWNKFNISPGGGIHEGDKDLDQDLPTKSKCKSKYVINTEEEREKREELDLLKAEMGRRIVLKHPIGPEKVKETMRDLGWGCSRNAITVVPNIRSQTLQVPSNTHKYKYKEKINSNSNSNSNSTNSRRVEHKVREIREDIEKKGEEMKEMREKKREERRVDINKLRDKLLATKSFLRPEQSKWDIRSQKTLSFMSGKENGHDGHGSKHESTNISPNIPNIPNIISNLPESPPINEPKKFLQRIDPPLPLSPKRSSFIRAPPSTTTPREPIYTTPTPHTNTYIPTPTAPPTPINNNSSHLFLIFSTQSKIQSRVEEAREALAIRNDFNLLQAFRDMAPGGYKDLLTLFDLERALKAIGVYSNGWDLGVLIYRYTKRGRDKGVIAYPQFCRLFVPKNDELAKVMGTRITKNTNKNMSTETKIIFCRLLQYLLEGERISTIIRTNYKNSKKPLKDIFTSCDIRCRGYITYLDIKRCFKEECKLEDQKFNIGRLFEFYGKKKDGNIYYEDFAKEMMINDIDQIVENSKDQALLGKSQH